MIERSRKGLGEVYMDHHLTEEERAVPRRLREIAREERALGKEVVRFGKVV